MAVEIVVVAVQQLLIAVMAEVMVVVVDCCNVCLSSTASYGN